MVAQLRTALGSPTRSPRNSLTSSRRRVTRSAHANHLSTNTAMPSSIDRIEKNVVINAPRSRVWNALADSQKFGEWFGVRFNEPFKPGAVLTGNITNKNYEHIEITAWIETIEPETHFAYRWHPHAIDTTYDYS